MLKNIPSMSLHINDSGALIPVVTGPITDSVLIIGNAVDGPSGRPIKVNSQTVERLFGPLVYNAQYAEPSTQPYLRGRFNGNNLVKAFYEVSIGGSSNIYLMRVGGTSATAYACTGTGAPASITSTLASATLGCNIDAKYPGAIYNNILITLSVTASATGEANISAATLEVAQAGDETSGVVNCKARKGPTVTYDLFAAPGIPKRVIDVIAEMGADTSNSTVVLTPNGAAYSDSILTDVAAALISGFTTGTTKKYFRLSGGADGTAMDTYATASRGATGLYADLTVADTGAFDMLQTVSVDVVYLACLYADQNVGTVAAPVSPMLEFAKALHTATVENYPMRGVMGLAPITATSVIGRAAAVARVTGLTATADGALTATNGYIDAMCKVVGMTTAGTTSLYGSDPDSGNKIDYGRYVQLVIGPDVILNQAQLGTYVESPAGLYAGFLTTVPKSRAATNMPLPGAGNIAFEFTRSEINKLSGGQPWDATTSQSGKGGSYVVLKRNSLGQTVVNLDNTCANRDSDYSSDQVLKVVNYAASKIKDIVSTFIGDGNTTAAIQAMDTEINAALDRMRSEKILNGSRGQGYDFKVTSPMPDAVIGRVRIDLLLRPALQIKEIVVVINVAPPVG